jgi:transcriptional regulator with XRE-family HTH domain
MRSRHTPLPEVLEWIDLVQAKEGWTVYDWARRAGLAQQTIWRYAIGESDMKLSTLRKMVDAADMPFVFGADTEYPIAFMPQGRPPYTETD